MSVTVIDSLWPSDPDRREILRYMRCSDGDPTIDNLVDEAINICKDKLSYKACYAEFEVKIDGSSCDFGFTTVESKSLAERLAGCSGAVVFAATVGLDIDRLILRYGRIRPSLAVAIGAVGTERVEALCDSVSAALGAEYAERGASLKPRYSPGYGDLSLSVQREIFAALGCDRRIGLTLNDSMIMSPSKSVTAIIGIY